MGDFNPNSPALLGTEFRPTTIQEVVLQGGGAGLAFRVVPGAGTIDQLVAFLKQVIGTPGLALEVLTSLDTVISANGVFPGISSAARYFPGSDTQAQFAGFEDNSNTATAAAVRAAIDDFQDRSNWARNVAAILPSSKLKIAYRGAGTALSGRRIAALEIVAEMRTIPGSGTAGSGPRIKGLFNIGGTDYLHDRGIRIPASNNWLDRAVAYAPLNPATLKPWTMAEANLFISSPTDEFGLQVDNASVAAEAFNIASLILEIFSCAENRKGSFYEPASVPSGWVPAALTATGAESANTPYYIHIYALNGSGSFTIPLAWDPRPDFVVTDDASAVGEHRLAYKTVLTDGGIVVAYEPLPGRMLPMLMSASGTFNSQSQPYADIVSDAHDATTPANVGQQIATTASTPFYATTPIPIGWMTSAPPTADLVIEFRHGVGSLTGGGSLLGTARLTPAASSQEMVDRVLIMDAAFDPPNSTSVVALLDTQAAAGAGWRIGRLDTRSDLLNGSLTAANVEGRSQGGQTDSYVVGGVQNTRYDIPIALVGGPGGGTTPTDPTPNPQLVPPTPQVYVEDAA